MSFFLTDPAVQKVDVTDLLLAYLKADSRTLSIVHDLRKQKGGQEK